MVDALATPKLLHDPGQLVRAVFRDEDRDRPAHDLFGRVAVDPLRSFVPAGDDSVERFSDDRVVGRVDDRRQVLGGPRAFFRRLGLRGHTGTVCHGFVTAGDRSLGRRCTATATSEPYAR